MNTRLLGKQRIIHQDSLRAKILTIGPLQSITIFPKKQIDVTNSVNAYRKAGVIPKSITCKRCVVVYEGKELKGTIISRGPETKEDSRIKTYFYDMYMIKVGSHVGPRMFKKIICPNCYETNDSKLMYNRNIMCEKCNVCSERKHWWGLKEKLKHDL